MEIFLYGVIFIFGTIIGSFLNVVIYRLHTGKSLNGRSHCMTCGKTLTWYELFPLVSYIFQGGKCRGCFAHIPSRYLFVELLTGLSYLTVWNIFAHDIFLLVVYFILVSVFILIVLYDIRHTIIPDELTSVVIIVAMVLVGYELMQGNEGILSTFAYRIGAGFIASFFFWGLWYISKGRWIGFGDAKLALPLGVIVGIGGIFSMIVLSFWIGAAVSLFLLGIERLLKGGKTNLHFLSTPLTIKSEVPFAPFLITGFLLVQFFHADIFNITYALFFS